MPSPTWIDTVLNNAISNRASDIHFEPGQNGLTVRFRIDGILYPVETLPRNSQEKIISRLKVMSQMDITQNRFPQDGHFEFSAGEKNYNIRSSIVPTVQGEAAVLRILNREDIFIKLESLGFYPDQLKAINQIITRPYGLVLITGPSGSGKTTLLYSVLNTLNNPGNNIVTLEDPVELFMPNVRQIQINDSANLTFPRAMRSILRQDSDVIMVGEIRDAETAQMAIQASLIGILVFSTFHTLDAPSLILRLIEIGIPRSVIAHVIAGIISTRLVRKICDSCKISCELTPFEKNILKKDLKDQKFQKGKGCKTCHNSGYLSRTGIFEVVPFDEEIRSYIIENAPISTLNKLFREKKRIKTLHEMAIQKVIDGSTTVEEVIRVTGVTPI